jgi:hypothetical protein
VPNPAGVLQFHRRRLWTDSVRDLPGIWQVRS